MTVIPAVLSTEEGEADAAGVLLEAKDAAARLEDDGVVTIVAMDPDGDTVDAGVPRRALDLVLVAVGVRAAPVQAAP